MTELISKFIGPVNISCFFLEKNVHAFEVMLVIANNVQITFTEDQKKQ